ncbi:hypothetical protein Rsub_02470 [Raphidocelis subcapitata]|uniref:Alpha/beta hydrolase fold-3 domain-containing protein n=1 Tax=Raphidocelis subcapitata TaxID=307507 RepID=A0A2V0NRV6_9CHLO|nr:hypothetical protein Rsub_02470 [Raphidocelis subcapitata]|eukprot:GBF90364.1 hypothetical protein Rsub_02470 [Raphidocelis subcapitata]
MVTTEALAEVAAYKRRTLLDHTIVGVPLLAGGVLRALLSAAARPFRRHELGWTLHQECLLAVMRHVLSARDLGVWRALFSVAGGLVELPGQVRTPIAPGSKSFWIALRDDLRPASPRGALTIAFVHGGGFIAGSSLHYVGTYDVWLRQLAARGIDARILSVHYPLAPEHPYPAGRDEVERVLSWLVHESGETAPLVVGGDSAGANLLLASLARLRDAGRLPAAARPRGALLISPCVDLSPESHMRSASAAPAAAKHDYLPAQHVNELVTHYYISDKDSRCPYASPALLPSFDGLVEGEVLVVWGGTEVLAPDIRAFAKRLAAADGSGSGPRASFYEAPGQVHSWPLLLLPGVERHEAPMWAFMERALGA